MDRTKIGPAIPITVVAAVPCNTELYTEKKSWQTVRRYMRMTDLIENANKL